MLKNIKWGEYKVSTLFHIQKITHMLSKESISDTSQYPVYSSESSNSGVIGYTDTEEPGSYVDIKDDFYYPNMARRRQIRNSIKKIKKEEPDVILYCDAFRKSFMFIKENKIFVYETKKGRSKEFNELVRETPNIDLIRRSNSILWPLFKGLENGSHPLQYRLTGHTPENEVRICPVLCCEP